MPENPRIGLDQGINLSGPTSRLVPGELRRARNCYYHPDSPELAKVGGRSLYAALGERISGLSHVRFRTSGAYLLAAGGTSYYTGPLGPSGSWTARATGLSSVGRMMAAYYLGTDRVYLVDGVNRMQVWDGSSSTMRNGGLTRAAAPTASFLNNGATTYPITTTFYYCVSEYDSVNDVESAPSDVVAISASAASGTFKLVLASAVNASSTKWRIYRTQHGGNIFYRLAEVAISTLRYYDGDDTELISGSLDNEDVFGTGFKTVDDLFLSTKDIMPMVGQPLRANYMTVNGTIPIGDIFGFFQGSAYFSGVPSFPHHLYYSMPDFPETVPPVNFIQVGADGGDPIAGAGIANDRLGIFTTHSIHRLNTFPAPTDPGFGLGEARLELVTSDHGNLAKESVINFGVGQPSNRLFYMSTRGPAMTDLAETWPLNQDLGWTDEFYNLGYVSHCIARNFVREQQIWLFAPSRQSVTNDVAMIYHYHPSHQKRGIVGKWTGPVHVRCAASTGPVTPGGASFLFIGDTDRDGSVYVQDSGEADGQNYDDPDGKILWEWSTGDDPLPVEGVNKRVKRVFLNVQGAADLSAPLNVAVSKNDKEFPVPLKLITDSKPTTSKVGTSDAEDSKTRTYRGGVWKTGSHFRFSMSELAKGPRSIVTLEPEIEGFGEQK